MSFPILCKAEQGCAGPRDQGSKALPWPGVRPKQYGANSGYQNNYNSAHTFPYTHAAIRAVS